MKFFVSIILFLIISCNQNIVPEFNQNRSFDFLIKQCEFGPRNPGSSGYQSFSIYLEKFLKEIDNEIIIQNFNYLEHITGKKREGKNFIIQFNKEAKKRMLIGAHWDTRALADEDQDSEKNNLPILGANDGASGTAVLMELALIFKNNNPPIGIDMIFFDAEDVGISGQPTTYAMGSEYFSKNLPIAKSDFGIIVDMVGDKNLNIPIERFSYRIDKKRVIELWDLASKLNLRAFKKEIGYEVYDDHVPLWKNANIPTIDIIDFDYPNSFYNHWHTQNDTPENCSAQSLGQVGTLLVNYIYEKF
jgi:Zn-dependent M28 family amino/carboxypeptidase